MSPLLADVSTAFLNSPMSEDEVQILVPAMDDQGSVIEGKYWLLRRKVYGLADAPRAWYTTLRDKLLSLGWTQLVEDPCVFIKSVDGNMQILNCYVDDIFAAGKGVQSSLAKTGYDLSKAKPFVDDIYLGITPSRTSRGFRLSTVDYITKRLKLPTWSGPIPKSPLPANIHDPATDTDNVTNPYLVTAFRGYVGQIGWLSHVCRIDLAYAFHYLSRFMSHPTKRSLAMAVRCLHYVYNTYTYGIHVPCPQESDVLAMFADASHNPVYESRRSQSGYVIGIMRPTQSPKFKDFYPIFWRSATQHKLQKSSMSAEFYSMRDGLAHLEHITRLLVELGHKLPKLVLIDAKDLSDGLKSDNNPKDPDLIPYLRSIRTQLAESNTTVVKIPREYMLADDLTGPRSQSQVAQLLLDTM